MLTALTATPALSYAEHLATASAGRPKGERTQAQIQIAACTVLDRSGPRDLTVSSVCEAAGISNGTFYIYFADRGALLDFLLTGFVDFLQSALRDASATRPDDPSRATTRAYVAAFARNRGLMRCLVHHLDSFPEAQSAFQTLNREWMETVVAAAQRKMQRTGQAGRISRPELLRRAYALGGMIDQYLSTLLLSQDPTLTAVSGDPEAVLETLTLIWERGMAP
ncbi:MAG: TetR/AcrR family transcriptional regulator [Rhodobacter sp.]|nr:TetR/AcrR family transcriptional regulator [Paracoccaceae bacterium]MCC0076882.1 TetR/AcrR family transcriptional regulator [Rhodobacter sp.]